MVILSFGSLNIDHVYQLEHIVRPGETLGAHTYAIHPGGKGLNQSLALARAGLGVWHAGRIGPGDQWLKDMLNGAGVCCDFVENTDTATGHAIIQVSPGGQNSIVLYAGANRTWTDAAVRRLFARDWQAVVCQNEMNGLAVLLQESLARNIPVIFNAAPFDSHLQTYDFTKLHSLLVNETEAMELAGKDSPKRAFAELVGCYPEVRVVLTLGGDGLWASYRGAEYRLPAYAAQLVDTTAAGDTFIGYYAASLFHHRPGDFPSALELGRRAAALAVSRAGAAPSIPHLNEL